MGARDANDRIADQAEQLRFVSRVPMLCECGRPGCSTIVMITLDDYRELRREPDALLVAPGHRVEGAELQRESADYTVLRAPRRRGANGGRRSA
jgi:hypothetical protein